MEELVYSDGYMVNPNFTDYRLPTSCDVPDIVSVIVESDDPEGPFGAKGVAEATIVPTCSAIANAVYDATGVRITDLPITPEKILAGLEKIRERGGDPLHRSGA
jgi:CO/xanthine dehydrogenase Mo-binding subunit